MYCQRSLYWGEQTSWENTESSLESDISISSWSQWNLYAFHDICAEGTGEDSLKEHCPYCLITNEIDKTKQNPLSIWVVKKIVKSIEAKKKTKYGRVIKTKRDQKIKEVEINNQIQVSTVSHCLSYLSILSMTKTPPITSLVFRLSVHEK